MKFKDLFFSKEKFFSVGIEESSGDYYVSIPVSNRKVDYEEYYRIDKSLFDRNASDLNQLEFVADECRKRLRDNDLIIKPVQTEACQFSSFYSLAISHAHLCLDYFPR